MKLFRLPVSGAGLRLAALGTPLALGVFLFAAMAAALLSFAAGTPPASAWLSLGGVLGLVEVRRRQRARR